MLKPSKLGTTGAPVKCNTFLGIIRLNSVYNFKIQIRPVKLRLFSEKFIVLEIADGPMGGYWVRILICPQKMQAWQLWIYRTDEKEYQIRSLENKPLTQADLKEFQLFLFKKYKNFWL